MKLPKISQPLFQLLIPSQKREVLCRPFVVKEEKILLTAQEGGNDKDIILALKQILNICIQDDTFDVNTLALFDLEYMFLKLRARSVNNVIDISYRDSEDEKIYEFKINLDEVEMLKEKDFDNKIMVSDTVGIVMKFPSITVLDDLNSELSPSAIVDYLIRKCIVQIFDEEAVYPINECTDEEITEFIESLDVNSFNKVRDFFDNIPQMFYKIEYTNGMGNKREIELTTLSDFFTWG